MDESKETEQDIRAQAEKASGVNIMSWSDLFLLLGLSTTTILLWEWFDTYMFKNHSQIIIGLFLVGYAACGLYLMRRRNRNLENALAAFEGTSKVHLYVIWALILALMLGAGVVISLFVDAVSCAVGFCIVK